MPDSPVRPEAPRPFVLLHHTVAGGEHWDLCIDCLDDPDTDRSQPNVSQPDAPQPDDARTLATWQLSHNPATRLVSNNSQPVAARRIADHRRVYLDYEGAISGNRGRVTRVDRGTCAVLSRDSRRWAIALTGSLLIGTFEIAAAEDLDDTWLLRRLESTI